MSGWRALPAPAGRHLIITVEEIVDAFAPAMNAVLFPHWLVTAVVHCPGGAYPSYAQGYYPRDNAFYLEWDAIARDRERFLSWMHKHVLETSNQQEFLKLIRAEAGA